MMRSTLNRKLLRNLREMWAQVATIALVVAAGVAAFVALQATVDSLQGSRDRYYEEFRFGDVFASLERAPDGVGGRLREISGVTAVDTRLVAPVRIPIEAATQPPIGEVVGLPAGGDAPLNRVLLLEGRMVEAGRGDEALLLEPFAERFGIAPGDTLPVIMEGTLRQVRIVGIANSPEYVYPAPPGGDAIPDEERFAALWMDRDAVAPAFRMEGAFNDVVLRLGPGASLPAVLAEVDRILDPYGGRGAVGRDRHRSNYFLDMRFEQLSGMATSVPVVFLAVAAFLLNVVLSRIINLERGEIAAMKALGYHNREIGLYYVKFVAVVVLLGTVGGFALGGWMGQGITSTFLRFFGLPLLEYSVPASTFVPAFAVALGFGLVGALVALRRILRLSPAEAMRPETPTRYRPSFLERLGVGDLFGTSGRMILRELSRHPVRTTLSSVGVALAVGIIVMGRFSMDAMDFIIDSEFYLASREDISVSLVGPTSDRAVNEVRGIPGVRFAEGLRVTSVRMTSDHRSRDVPLYGYPDENRLRILLDGEGRRVPMPTGGVVLTRTLAEMLGVEAGDTVRVRLREGRADERPLVVTGTVTQAFGLQGHMRLEDLNRLLGEDPAVNQLRLAVERGAYPEVERRLSDMPRVLEVTRKEQAVARMRALSGDTQRVLVLVLSLFGAVIAVGVVYNNARVALSVRARDLGSLRVLGFTRREVSTILVGEQMIQVLVALPFGLWIGRILAGLLAGTIDQEEYRFPLLISTETYAFAVSVVLAAALVSAFLVRRRLDRLDLIGVLKTRE